MLSAKIDSENPSALMATITEENHYERDEWILDSCATFHITPCKELLFDLKEFDGQRVQMANNTFSRVKGMGKVKVINSEGVEVILSEVRYMPEAGKNLISYGLLERSGYRYEGRDFRVQFYKGDKKVLAGDYRNGLYYFDGTVTKNSVLMSKSEIDMTARWHSRLGHMSIKGMKVLVKEGYINEKEVTDLSFCESCVLGKSHKQSFGKGKHTSKEVLKYVHSDLWGSPSTPMSLGECFYFVTFIDDFSRKVWIYFLRTKNEVFSRFKEWKAEVETETGKKLKCLRTDNGLEFCNNQMDQLCKYLESRGT